jgi:hypothetical protein
LPLTLIEFSCLPSSFHSSRSFASVGYEPVIRPAFFNCNPSTSVCRINKEKIYEIVQILVDANAKNGFDSEIDQDCYNFAPVITDT